MNKKIYKNRKLIFVFMFLFSCLISCGSFPIFNFNNDNKVNLGITMDITLIVMSFLAYYEIGTLQAVMLKKKSIIFVIILNILLILLGIVFRYLIEFGEVSNIYNFTIANVLFHVFIMTFFCILGFLIKRKKQNA